MQKYVRMDFRVRIFRMRAEISTHYSQIRTREVGKLTHIKIEIFLLHIITQWKFLQNHYLYYLIFKKAAVYNSNSLPDGFSLVEDFFFPLLKWQRFESESCHPAFTGTAGSCSSSRMFCIPSDLIKCFHRKKFSGILEVLFGSSAN